MLSSRLAVRKKSHLKKCVQGIWWGFPSQHILSYGSAMLQKSPSKKCAQGISLDSALEHVFKQKCSQHIRIDAAFGTMDCATPFFLQPRLKNRAFFETIVHNISMDASLEHILQHRSSRLIRTHAASQDSLISSVVQGVLKGFSLTVHVAKITREKMCASHLKGGLWSRNVATYVFATHP